MLNYQNEEYITLDELKETVPSIFTKNGGPTTSEKYTHIPTDKVIKDMELLGWKVADAKEVAARTSDTKTFQKHLVVFRNPDISITSKMKNVTKDDTSPTGYRKIQQMLFGHKYCLQIVMMVKIHLVLLLVYLE